MPNLRYKNIDNSILTHIEEAKQIFPGRIYENSAQEARDFFAKYTATLHLTRNKEINVSDCSVSTSDGVIPVRIYKPVSQRTPPRTLLFMHGGGWIMGDLNSHDQVCVDLCLRCKITVIALDYALSPENRFPVALNQCFSTYLMLLKDKTLLGHDSERILICGDSAGGNLAAALSLKLRIESKPLPRAQILFYPCLSLDFNSPSYITFSQAPILDKNSMRWFWGAYLNENYQIQNPLAVPLTEKNLTSLPETIMCTAEIDPLASEGLKFVENLRKCSNTVEHIHAKAMVHGFIRFREKSFTADSYFSLVCQKINTILSNKTN